MAKIKVCENNVSDPRPEKEWKWTGVVKLANEEKHALK